MTRWHYALQQGYLYAVRVGLTLSEEAEARGNGQSAAMLCASVREKTRQCLTELSACDRRLGLWNKHKASDKASAQSKGGCNDKAHLAQDCLQSRVIALHSWQI